MRRLLALLLMLGVAVAPGPQPSAAASCAAPDLEVATSPLVLERGARLVLRGRSFSEGCQDSMSCTGTWGCDTCRYDDPPPEPMQDVVLRLEQAHRSWVLGEVDAEGEAGGRRGRVSWTVDVPRDARRGAATLVADHAEPLRVRIH